MCIRDSPCTAPLAAHARRSPHCYRWPTATICAIWVKAEGHISVISTGMICLLLPLMIWSIVSMAVRLNDGDDEPGTLNLVADGKKQSVGEFRVGDMSSIPVDPETGKMSSKADERSALLKCAFPPPRVNI
eukprot:7386826-Prymnesium_polylepis.3